MSDIIEVLSDDGNCNCGAGGQVPIQPSPNLAESIVIRTAPGTEVGNIINQYQENGKTVYELDDLDLNDPVVVFTNDAGTREVGETVATVNFSGEITQGTYPIVTRSITPDPGGLNLSAPFGFVKNNVKRTTAGVAESHTVQAVDNQGNSTVVNSSVPFKDAIFQGFNSLAVLNQAEIKALANKHLVDSIAQQYGGVKTYVVPAGGSKYIYFAGAVGTPAPAGAVLNGLTLPLTTLAAVDVTNPHDGAIIRSYWVVRTANRFDPGTYEITLS
jgi:hypothetical protein